MSTNSAKTSARPLILAITAAAIVAALWVRADRSHQADSAAAKPVAAAAAAPAAMVAAPGAAVAEAGGVLPGGPGKRATPKALPTFIELGSDRCKSCKAMIPVLDQLRKEAKGRLTVQFYDVWDDEAAGKRFHVRSIPTQVLQGPDGKELFRHQGYFPFTSVVAKWTELGFDVLGTAAPKPGNPARKRPRITAQARLRGRRGIDHERQPHLRRALLSPGGSTPAGRARRGWLGRRQHRV